jgi:hypothetical protein
VKAPAARAATTAGEEDVRPDARREITAIRRGRLT